MSKTLLTIRSKGEGYTAIVNNYGDGSYGFMGDMDIDIDGSPNWHIDPCGQADTTLHHNGKPINGQEVPFIVLPPECIRSVKGIVLGCKAVVRFKERISDAVVADVGPHNKLGEGSPSLARALHINDDPNVGGVDNPLVEYRYWPDVPANIHGVEYELQSYRS